MHQRSIRKERAGCTRTSNTHTTSPGNNATPPTIHCERANTRGLRMELPFGPETTRRATGSPGVPGYDVMLLAGQDQAAFLTDPVLLICSFFGAAPADSKLAAAVSPASNDASVCRPNSPVSKALIKGGGSRAKVAVAQQHPFQLVGGANNASFTDLQGGVRRRCDREKFFSHLQRAMDSISVLQVFFGVLDRQELVVCS